MTQDFIYNAMRCYRLAVLAYSGGQGPQAALVGIAVTDGLEIVFDTVRHSRKYQQICRHPEVAIVLGWEGETTVQYEGMAVELRGPEGDDYREVYYEAYPDGRQRAKEWPGLVHFVVRPRWIRYSNFLEPVVVEEWRPV
jgi:hypothetical protein